MAVQLAREGGTDINGGGYVAPFPFILKIIPVEFQQPDP